MAATPVPTYITLQNVLDYIGEDKIQVSDTQPNAIKVNVANGLVAKGESKVIEDLSVWYVVTPTLLSVSGGDWTTLPTDTYNQLFYAFIYCAAEELIYNYITRNTNERYGDTISELRENYSSAYNSWLARLRETLPNGAYKFQLSGLKINDQNAIMRTPRRYAITSPLGGCTYTNRQLTNPRESWMGGLLRFRNNDCC